MWDQLWDMLIRQFRDDDHSSLSASELLFSWVAGLQGHIVLVRTLPQSLNPQLVVFQECEKSFVWLCVCVFLCEEVQGICLCMSACGVWSFGWQFTACACSAGSQHDRMGKCVFLWTSVLALSLLTVNICERVSFSFRPGNNKKGWRFRKV